MPHILPGDLVIVSPNSPLYPVAFSSPAAHHTPIEYIMGLVVGEDSYYCRILFPDGSTPWLHHSSCRPARKADRT